MDSASLQQALTQVIANLLARNRSYFGAGGPGYYGVEVENVSSDGSEFDFILTFKSGVRYCCVEHGCHIALYGSDKSCAGWFKKVRDGLKAAGVANLPPMTVRKLHVVVEKGTISDGLPNSLYTHDSKLEYGRGPFHEVEDTDGERPSS
jgi:hypothetical protein